MGHGFETAYPLTMASGDTLTPALDLTRSWPFVYLDTPGLGAEAYIKGASTLTGTYRRITHASLNSATVGTNDFAIASAASNRIVPIPGGIRYIKVETSAAVADGAYLKIICADN